MSFHDRFPVVAPLGEQGMPDAPAPATMGGLVQALLRRSWIVVLVAFLGAAGAFFVSEQQTKVYQASSQVQLDSEDLVQSVMAGTTAGANQFLEQMQLMQGVLVLAQVSHDLGHPAPAVDILESDSVPQDVTITSSALSAVAAADVANDYAQAYVTVIHNQTTRQLNVAVRQLNNEIATLQESINSLTRKQVSAAAVSPEGRTISAHMSVLNAEQSFYQSKLEQLQLDGSLGLVSDASVLQPATVPTAASTPRTTRNGFLGGVVGLFLGTSLVLYLATTDDRLRTAQDAARASSGLPVLAFIQGRSARWRGRTARARSESAQAEAYRALRATIAANRSVRSLLVVGVGKGNDAHALVVAGLGVAFARAGQPTTVVAADFRNGDLGKLLGVVSGMGLSAVVAGEASIEAVTQEVEGLPMLRLVARGAFGPLSPELLAWPRTRKAIEDLVRQGQMVLMDCAPLPPYSDAAAASALVDGVILLVSTKAAGAAELRTSVESLHRVRAPMFGVILHTGRRAPSAMAITSARSRRHIRTSQSSWTRPPRGKPDKSAAGET